MLGVVLIPLSASSSFYWLFTFLGAFVFVCALLFEMEYTLSNVLLIVSAAILCATVGLLSVEVKMIVGTVLPMYSILALPLGFVFAMKHLEQIAVYAGAILVGAMFAIAYSDGSLLVPVVGLILGAICTFLMRGASNTGSWNAQVASFMFFVGLIVAAGVISWLLAPGLDLSLSVGLVLVTIFGSVLCIGGLLLPEPHRQTVR